MPDRGTRPPRGLVCATIIEITANPRARSSHVSRPVIPSPYRDGQHSMTFTARPPSLVSLYFVIMSMPVWRMVSITMSSDTRWVPSP